MDVEHGHVVLGLATDGCGGGAGSGGVTAGACGGGTGGLQVGVEVEMVKGTSGVGCNGSL